MDYTEQGQSIQFIVNDSKTLDEAKARYVALEGLLMPKDVADGIFGDAVNQKFQSKPKTAAALLLAEINGLENSL